MEDFLKKHNLDELLPILTAGEFSDIEFDDWKDFDIREIFDTLSDNEEASKIKISIKSKFASRIVQGK